jgi:hypothetical protein
MTDTATKTIKEIPGLTSPDPNEEYQNLIFDAAWKAILLATKHPDSNKAFLRNQDIVDALLKIQAMVLSSGADAKVPSRLRQHCDEFAKGLRKPTQAFVDDEKLGGEKLFEDMIDTDKPQ